MLRRSVVVGAMLVMLAALLPAAPALAALNAPVLLSPVGGSVPTVDVELHWQRLPGAVAYHVQVFHIDPSGFPVLDEHTVNDRWIGRIDLAGGVAYWSVAAVDGDGVEGEASHATFTTASLAPEPLWPPDGAALVHPADTPVLAWRSVSYSDQAYGDQSPAAPDPPVDVLRTPKLGSWRWQPGGADSYHAGVPIGTRGELRTFTYGWPDATPVGLAPADGTHVAAGSSFRISWDAVPGAGGYEWQLTAPGEEPPATIGGGQLATWGDVRSNLEPGMYEWRVRARLAGTEMLGATYGPWSAVRTVVVDPLPVTAGLEPADGATLPAWPLLRWVDVPGADHYDLQISDTKDETAYAGHSDIPAFAFGAADLTSTMFHAAPGTVTRWWRVRPVRVAVYQSAGPWGPWQSFTVQPAGGTLPGPTEATLLGPDDCASAACPDIAGSPILRWAPVPGATFYRVFQAADGNPAHYLSTQDIAGTAVPVMAYYRPAPGDHTAWGVIACASTADCPTTMPATVRHFALSLPVPSVVVPADGLVQAGPAVALEWSAPAASSADVLASFTTFDLASTTAHAGSDPNPNQPQYLAANTMTTIEGFGDGDTVAWKVRATSRVGLQSAWTAPRSIHRDEPALQILGPDPAETQSPTPKLSWAAPGYTAFGYEVEIARADDAAIYGPGYFRWRLGASGTSVHPSFPLPPGEYRWRVRRGYAGYHIPQENVGRWSEGTFTVAGEPQVKLLSPAPGASVRADAVLLEWTPMPDALETELQVPGYALLVGTTPDLTWDTSIYHYYTDSSRHAVELLLPEGDLYWRVCAAVVCSETSSLWTGASEVRALHVTKPPVADTVRPTSTTPRVSLASSAVMSGSRTPVRVTWSGDDIGTGVDHYVLQLATDGGVYRPLSEPAVAAATPQLLPGHTYRFRVQAVDGANNHGDWGLSRSFSVVARQQSSSWVHWAGTWRRVADTAWWGGSARASTDAGASATTTFTGRGIAWVTATGLTRGSARIYVNGVLQATVSLRAAAGTRRIAWAKTWSTSATRTIRIKVVGTSGHPRVDVDGFVILR